jgi:hypothetical protein
MEFKIARLQGRARQILDTRLAPLPQRFRPHHFLWACAVMPIFMLPPLVSLFVALSSMRRASGNGAAVNFEWIAIVSAINLILSGLLLYKFHFSPPELLSYLHELIAALLRSGTHYLPGQPPPAHLTPI